MITLQTIQEKLSVELEKIDIISYIQQTGTCKIENVDYYSKCFS